MCTRKCKYCLHTSDRGLVCNRAHILGFESFGVAPCLATIDAAKGIRRNLNVDTKAQVNINAKVTNFCNK